MQTSIKSFMSGDPAWIAPDASALEALERMLDLGIRHLPVLDVARRVVGVVSIDDLRAALPYASALTRPLDRPARETALEWRVGDIMSHAPETLGPDAPVAEAAVRMAERRIGCLPIVDASGRLAGLLSETDVLWALANQGSEPRAQQRDFLASLVVELARERERVSASLVQRSTAERSIEDSMRDVPLDRAERGADQAIVDESIALGAFALRRLAAIDAALDRVADGAFGRCEACGGPIAIARLRALPSAAHCIDCARKAPVAQLQK